MPCNALFFLARANIHVALLDQDAKIASTPKQVSESIPWTSVRPPMSPAAHHVFTSSSAYRTLSCTLSLMEGENFSGVHSRWSKTALQCLLITGTYSTSKFCRSTQPTLTQSALTSAPQPDSLSRTQEHAIKVLHVLDMSDLLNPTVMLLHSVLCRLVITKGVLFQLYGKNGKLHDLGDERQFISHLNP